MGNDICKRKVGGNYTDLKTGVVKFVDRPSAIEPNTRTRQGDGRDWKTFWWIVGDISERYIFNFRSISWSLETTDLRRHLGVVKSVHIYFSCLTNCNPIMMWFFFFWTLSFRWHLNSVKYNLPVFVCELT